jgi:CBS domain-containing protein
MTSMPRHRIVSDVMTSRVHVAGPDMPFKLLVRLIEENRVSAIPIVDRTGVPIGLVSEADLLLKEQRDELESGHNLVHPRRRRDLRAKAAGNVASELMTSPPITITSGASLTEAARVMQERNVRRLVVVDERGRIAGIVSRRDLLQVFMRTDEELREEIVGKLIPQLLWPVPAGIRVDVRWNVVTLTGEVDRKSDIDVLARLARGLDGVVDLVNSLTYRWDDQAQQPRDAAPIARTF